MSIHFDKKAGKRVETLVFLHGNSSSSAVYDHFFDMHEEYSLFRFDFPGHGRNRDSLPDQFGLEALVKCTIETIKSIVTNPCIIIGNSLGGHIGMEATGHLPDLKALVLMGAPPLKKPMNFEEASRDPSLLPRFLNPDLSDDELRNIFIEASRNHGIVDDLVNDFKNTHADFRPNFVKSILENDESLDEYELVDKMDIPVYFIHGVEDPLVNINYIKAINGIDKIYEIEACGHYPSWEKPSTFQQIVEEISEEVFMK